MNTNQILQRSGGIVRGYLRITDRIFRRVSSKTYGVIQNTLHLRQAPKPDMDDLTLTRKVESVIFRGERAPKATVNVNVVDGVVWLRGEVKRPEQVKALEKAARSVPEVRGVENLLHLHKTPAPTRSDTPGSQQRTRSSTRRPAPRSQGRRITGDRSGALADSSEHEPSPAEKAETGEGRTPAPFGARGGADETGGNGAGA